MNGLLKMALVMVSLATLSIGGLVGAQEDRGSAAPTTLPSEGAGLALDGQPCGERADCPAGLACLSGACALQCDDVELPHIYFDADEAAVRADQEPVLAQVIACMTAFPERRIRVEGHTDERGSAEFNMAVSQRLARSVQRYLERQGVDVSRIETMHYGESRPVCTEHEESCWRRNRRAEIHWIELVESGADP